MRDVPAGDGSPSRCPGGRSGGLAGVSLALAHLSAQVPALVGATQLSAGEAGACGEAGEVGQMSAKGDVGLSGATMVLLP